MVFCSVLLVSLPKMMHGNQKPSRASDLVYPCVYQLRKMDKGGKDGKGLERAFSFPLGSGFDTYWISSLLLPKQSCIALPWQ